MSRLAEVLSRCSLGLFVVLLRASFTARPSHALLGPVQLCARSSHGGQLSKRAAAPANAIIVQLALAPVNNGLLVFAGLGLALREVRQTGRCRRRRAAPQGGTIAPLPSLLSRLLFSQLLDCVANRPSSSSTDIFSDDLLYVACAAIYVRRLCNILTCFACT